MDDNSGSKDKALEALDFIINVLKEHEQTLDESIHELAIVTEQKMDTEALNGKIDRLDEKVNILQKEVTALIDLLLHAPTPNREPHAAVLCFTCFHAERTRDGFELYTVGRFFVACSPRGNINFQLRRARKYSSSRHSCEKPNNHLHRRPPRLLSCSENMAI